MSSGNGIILHWIGRDGKSRGILKGNGTRKGCGILRGLVIWSPTPYRDVDGVVEEPVDGEGDGVGVGQVQSDGLNGYVWEHAVDLLSLKVVHRK